MTNENLKGCFFIHPVHSSFFYLLNFVFWHHGILFQVLWYSWSILGWTSTFCEFSQLSAAGLWRKHFLQHSVGWWYPSRISNFCRSLLDSNVKGNVNCYESYVDRVTQIGRIYKILWTSARKFLEFFCNKVSSVCDHSSTFQLSW